MLLPTIALLPERIAQLLALVVGVSSLFLFPIAFFVPVLYRKRDFIWSGFGLFYGVVLWFCAAQFTLTVLAGQAAAVLLLVWLGNQALKFRWLELDDRQRASVPWVGRTYKRRHKAEASIPSLGSPQSPKPEAPEPESSELESPQPESPVGDSPNAEGTTDEVPPQIPDSPDESDDTPGASPELAPEIASEARGDGVTPPAPESPRDPGGGRRTRSWG
jgi:hypothetical protein